MGRVSGGWSCCATALVPLLVVLAAAPAAADAPPAVDARDLPPLPEALPAETAASIAVAAAQRADEDTVVGAAKREQSLGSVASAVTVIPGDRLRRFGYRTLAEALRAVAGVYVTDDRYTERIGIRGLQIPGDFNTRILVLIDGATISEPWNQFTGIAHDLPVHLDDVARIEVVRGPVGAMYGTNAFFGIINIVTQGADQSPRAYGRLTTGYPASLGGNVGFALGDVHRQVRGTFAYFNRWGDTLSIPEFAAAGGDPRTKADGLSAFNTSLVARYYGFFAQVRAFKKERMLTGAPYETAMGDGGNQESDAQASVEAGYTHEFGRRLTVTARAYFNRYQYRDHLVYQPDAANFVDVGDSLWTGGEVRARLRVLPAQLLGLTVGAESTYNVVSSHSYNEGEDGVRVPTRFFIQGVYAEADSTPLRWLSLVAGARFDYNSVFAQNLSPRGAVMLHRGDRYGLKLLYAEGFRNPSPYEAFFYDNISLIANHRLRPEKIRSYEAVGWYRPVAGLNVRLSGFRWETRDLLEQVSVDTTDGPRLQFTNAFQLRSTGVEAEGSYRDTRGWMAFATFTFAYVTRDHETALAFSAPRYTATAGVSTPKLLRIGHVSTEVRFLSSRLARQPDDPAQTALRVDPYFVWNVAIHIPNLKRFDLTVGVRNLVGNRERQPVSSDFDRPSAGVPIYTLPGDGREFYARLGYSY